MGYFVYFNFTRNVGVEQFYTRFYLKPISCLVEEIQ